MDNYTLYDIYTEEPITFFKKHEYRKIDDPSYIIENDTLIPLEYKGGDITDNLEYRTIDEEILQNECKNKEFMFNNTTNELEKTFLEKDLFRLKYISDQNYINKIEKNAYSQINNREQREQIKDECSKYRKEIDNYYESFFSKYKGGRYDPTETIKDLDLDKRVDTLIDYYDNKGFPVPAPYNKDANDFGNKTKVSRTFTTPIQIDTTKKYMFTEVCPLPIPASSSFGIQDTKETKEIKYTKPQEPKKVNFVEREEVDLFVTDEIGDIDDSYDDLCEFFSDIKDVEMESQKKDISIVKDYLNCWKQSKSMQSTQKKADQLIQCEINSNKSYDEIKQCLARIMNEYRKSENNYKANIHKLFKRLDFTDNRKQLDIIRNACNNLYHSFDELSSEAQRFKYLLSNFFSNVKNLDCVEKHLYINNYEDKTMSKTKDSKDSKTAKYEESYNRSLDFFDNISSRNEEEAELSTSKMTTKL